MSRRICAHNLHASPMARLLVLTTYLALALAQDDAVLESSLDVLTFDTHNMTHARRFAPEPHLQCTRGCDLYTLPVVVCTNQGTDDHDGVVWRCDQGTYPSHLEVYDDAVQCEGYAHAGDKTVLRGSCMYTYALRHTTATNPRPLDTGILVVLGVMTLVVTWSFMASNACNGPCGKVLQALVFFHAMKACLRWTMGCMSVSYTDGMEPTVSRRRKRPRHRPRHAPRSWSTWTPSHTSSRSSRTSSRFTITTSRRSR